MIQKSFYIFILLCSFFTSRAQNSINITSIANDGFLISCDTSKIIIDGIFNEGNGNPFVPSDEILAKERNASYPFDSINLILDTHYHNDHINPGFIVEHMINNPNALFVGPQQSYDLFTSLTGFNSVNEKVISINPAFGLKYDTTINHTPIEVVRLNHNNDADTNIEVNGYIFKMNNICIFHPGDGGLNNLTEIETLNLADDSIDIAFLPYWIIGDKYETTGKKVIEYLKPKIIVLMHVWVSQVDYYKNHINEISNVPQIYYLEKSLDKLYIEKVTDSIKGTYISLNSSIHTSIKNFKIYPNPVKDELFIKDLNIQFQNASAEVFNDQGIKLFHQEICYMLLIALEPALF